MGVVYRAHDSLLERPVAIKTLSPAMFGAEGARRFLREAQSVAKLNHPHIVSIFDAVEEGGQFAIVMELVEGQARGGGGGAGARGGGCCPGGGRGGRRSSRRTRSR